MVIKLIIGGLNSIHGYKKKLLPTFTNYKYSENNSQSSSASTSTRNNNTRVSGSIKKWLTTNKLSTCCTPELVSISEFKDSVEKLFNSLTVINIISFVENNDFIKVVININNEDEYLYNVYGFIRAINEKLSHSEGSAILNNWRVTDNINYKKIQITLSNNRKEELELSIVIPNNKNKPIEIEYIKPVHTLSKKDIDSFSALIKPYESTCKTNTIDDFFKPYSFSKNHDLLEFVPIQKYFSDQVEAFLSENNLSNFTSFKNNLAFSKEFDELKNNNLESNPHNKGLSKEYKQFLIDNSNVISSLEDLGVKVYFNDNKGQAHSDPWDSIGGYDNVKKQINEHILLHFKHPELLYKIATGTRVKTDSNIRPRLILFEGPPGTGKTTSARIIGNVVNVPLVYVSLENIVSKWFGESETRMSKIFDLTKKFEKGCVLFIDEVETMATSRDKMEPIHEGSKKILSVLLRKIDGFDTLNTKTLLICATNRKKDLDSAFVNRIDSTVYFPLPNEKERELIFKQYAKHLTYEERVELAKISGKLSGRSIRHVCLEAEREWASILLKKKVEKSSSELELPTLKVYKDAIKKRCGQITL